MVATRFAHPVSIFVGLGFPREVETVEQSFEVLSEWSGSRGPTHSMALAKTRSALRGEDDAATARIAFEAFARKVGILAPEALENAAAKAIEEWMGVQQAVEKGTRHRTAAVIHRFRRDSEVTSARRR